MILAVDFTETRQPADGRRLLQWRSLRLLGVGLRADPRRHRPLPLRVRLHLHLAAYLVFCVHDPGRPAVLARGHPRHPRRLCVVGVAIERFVYRPLAGSAGATALLAVFVGVARHRHRRREPDPPPVLASATQQLSDGPSPCARRSTGDRRRSSGFDVWQAVERPSCIVARPGGAAALHAASVGRSRPPASTPSWPGPSASTPNRIYLIVLLPSARSAPAWPPSGTASSTPSSRPWAHAGDLRLRRGVPRPAPPARRSGCSSPASSSA